MKTIKIQIIIVIIAGLLFAADITAQKAERARIREGNKLYQKEQFTEAEIAYRKSIEVNPRSFEGTYDLGNALYKQQKYPEAAEQYQTLAAQSERIVADNPDNISRLAQVFHNLGNISMQSKEYGKSVEAYKQSLRLNPADDETRYNLALAQKLLQNQQQEQNQDQKKDEQQEQQQEQQNQEQQPPQQDEQQQEQQPEEMSRENAEQILDTFLEDEKETQEKVKQQQEKQRERRRTDKEW
ncbi:MAG: tetratricopeptide repeat protein [Tannerella sp.]|jgi:tetratricopeptide (TPR) repeat protein|nr:tetratricopeptide repeat protein [Tannerella sp.]